MIKAFLLVIICAFCSFVLAQEEPKKQESSQEEIKKLIEKLGSEAWREREDAQKELIKIGWPAGPALEEAMKHEDPEIATKAERILDKICYLPEKQKAEVDALFEQLKNRDEKTRENAFDTLLKKEGRVIKYLTRLLNQPSDDNVELSLELEYSHVDTKSNVGYVVKMANKGKKPVWVPDFGSKIGGEYRAFGTGSTAMSWSRGGRGKGDFRFLYLAPGEERTLKGGFMPYSGRVGMHTMVLRLSQEKGIVYTARNGEEAFLPVRHFMPKKIPTAQVAVLPEIVEGETGKPRFGLAAGADAKQKSVKKDDSIDIKFMLKNFSDKGKDILLKEFSSCWYLLAPVDRKKPFGAEARLELSDKVDSLLEPGKSFGFTAKIKMDVEPGEYYLFCGFNRRGSDTDEDNAFRGEVITNTLKITVTAPDEK